MAFVLTVAPAAFVNDISSGAANPSSLSGLQLGAFDGAANPTGVESFGQETGASMSIYSDYLAGSSLAALAGRTGAPPWVIAQMTGKLGDMRPLISVPLVRGHLTSQAALAHDITYPSALKGALKTLAQNLVAAGFGNAIIRFMWEPDSGIYSNDDLTSAANYATVWRNAHTAMMSVSGAQFQWAWYWGGNFDATTNNTAYPGDAYVDYVTFDFYDQSWDANCGIPYNGTPFTVTQENCLWNGVAADYDTGFKGLLGNLAAFATAHGKPIGIGEFGVINRSDGHGGGDDPTFISNFSTWLKANNVAWASYFNFNSGGDSVLADFPNSLAAFRTDLG
jgi:hypothetical protein